MEDKYFELLYSLAHSQNLYQEIITAIAHEETIFDPDEAIVDEGIYAETIENTRELYRSSYKEARYHHLNALEAFRKIADSFLLEDREQAEAAYEDWAGIPFDGEY